MRRLPGLFRSRIAAFAIVMATLVSLAQGASQAVPGEASIPPAELERATWVEGRIVFPPGTPADEKVFVTALGIAFSTRTHHRAEVGADGRFRVAFERRTKQGLLRVDARYSIVEKNVFVRIADARAPISITPELGSRVVGRCIPSPSMRGREAELVGAVVTLAAFDEKRGLVRRTAKLDAELSFEFGALPSGIDAELAFASAHAAPIEQHVDALAPGAQRRIELMLVAAITLRGRVVDSDGKPIAGAVFEVSSRAGPELRADFAIDPARTTSASDGTFELTGLPPGDWTVTATAAGYRPATCDTGVLAEGAVREGLLLTLPSGLSIRGRVTWPDGKPAASAAIEWRPLNRDALFVFGELLGESESEVWTADDGTFEIPALDDGAYEIEARAVRDVPSSESGAPDSVFAQWRASRTDVRAGTSDLVLALRPPASISGRVVDDLGQPIRSFRIRALLSHGAIGGGRATIEAEQSFDTPDGRFVLSAVPEGEVNLEVESVGATQSMSTPVQVPGDGAPVEVRLLRNARIVGAVVDPHGVVVRQATIELRDELGNDAEPRDHDAAVQSDELGRFELQMSPDVVLLYARAEAWAESAVERLVLAPGETHEVVLRVLTGGKIEGELLGADGRPEAHRGVRVSRRFGRSLLVKTDAAGRFEVASLGPGTYRVFTTGDELAIDRTASVEVRDGETTQVVLGASPVVRVRVRGTVRAGSAPRAGVHIEATRRANNPDYASVEATSGADGRFELGLSAAGIHSFELDAGGTSIRRWVRVPNEPEFELDLVLPDGSIRGRVVGPDGRPLEGIDVELKPDANSIDRTATYTTAQVSTGADGVFRFEHLESATYRVQAGATRAGGDSITPRFGQTTREGLEIRDGTHLSIELAMSKSCSLVGAVRYDDGAPGTGIEVFGRDEQGALFDRDDLVLTDRAGRFRIDGLPAGRATFFARGVGYASHESAPVVIGGTSAATLEIVLAAATRVYVDVVDEAGKAVSRVQVRVFDERGRDCKVRLDDASPDDELPGQLEATLPPGNYRIVARHENGTSAEVAIAINDERTVGVKLQLAR